MRVSPDIGPGKDLRRIAVGQTHDVLGFSKVDQRNSLAHIFLFGAGSFEFPDLDVCDAFKAVGDEHLRRTLQGVFPAIAEIIGKEVVRILVVSRRLHVELRRLGPALDGQAVRLAFLLACHRRQAPAAQLEFAFDAEQALAAANQTRGRRKVDVSGFDILDNFVFVSLVLQPELVLKLELILRIPVNVNVEFVADRARDTEADVLIEFRGKPPGSPRNGHLLVAFTVFEASLDAGLPVYAKAHGGGAEYSTEGAFPAAGYRNIERKTAPGSLSPLLGLLFADDTPVVAEPGVQAALPVGFEVDDERISYLALPDEFPDDEFLPGGIELDFVPPVVAQCGEEGAAGPLDRGCHPAVGGRRPQVKIRPPERRGIGSVGGVAKNNIECGGVRVEDGGVRIGNRVFFRRGRNLCTAVVRRHTLQQERNNHGACRMYARCIHAIGTLLSRYAYGVRTHPTSSR